MWPNSGQPARWFLTFDPDMDEESWKKARRLLIGAVDTVLKKDANQLQVCVGQSSSSSSSSNPPKKPTVYEEHRRLFGYKPSKEYSYSIKNSKRG